MKQIFVDTDIILDFLACRDPFVHAARQIFKDAEEKKLQVHVSSLCFSNLFYILRKSLSCKDAQMALSDLRKITTVLAVDEDVIDAALTSSFKDFKDGIQYFTAKSAGIPVLLTRNIKDYRGNTKEMEILTADEYLTSKLHLE